MVIVRTVNSSFTFFGILIWFGLCLFSGRTEAVAERPRQCSDAFFSITQYKQKTHERYLKWSTRFTELVGPIEFDGTRNATDKIHFAIAKLPKEKTIELQSLLGEGYLDVILRKYDGELDDPKSNDWAMYHLKRIYDFAASRLDNPLEYFREGIAAGKSVDELYSIYLENAQKKLGLPETYNYTKLMQAMKWIQAELVKEIKRNPQAAKWSFSFYGSSVMGRGVLPHSDLDVISPQDEMAARFLNRYRNNKEFKEKFGFDHISLNRMKPSGTYVRSVWANPIILKVSAESLTLQIFPLIGYDEANNGNLNSGDRYKLNP